MQFGKQSFPPCQHGGPGNEPHRADRCLRQRTRQTTVIIERQTTADPGIVTDAPRSGLVEDAPDDCNEPRGSIIELVCEQVSPVDRGEYLTKVRGRFRTGIGL